MTKEEGEEKKKMMIIRIIIMVIMIIMLEYDPRDFKDVIITESSLLLRT
jgi:hypothetical protein